MVVGGSLGQGERFPTPTPSKRKDYIGVADSDATYKADCMPEIDRTLRTKICRSNCPHLMQSAFSEDRAENQKVFCLRQDSNRRFHFRNLQQLSNTILPTFDTPLFRPQWPNAMQRETRLSGSAMVRQSSTETCWKPPNRTFSHPGTSGWKHLISRIFPSHEVVTIIEGIFVDEEKIKALDGPRGDGAQIFIDVVLRCRSWYPPTYRGALPYPFTQEARFD